MAETPGRNEKHCHVNGAAMAALIRMFLGGAPDLNECSDRMSYTTDVLRRERTVRQCHSQHDAGRHLTSPRRVVATALVSGGLRQVNTTPRPCVNHVLPPAEVLVLQVGATMRRTTIGTQGNRARLGRNGWLAPHKTTTMMKVTATD
jgi:non-ribosomal peptide synthetase component F